MCSVINPSAPAHFMLLLKLKASGQVQPVQSHTGPLQGGMPKPVRGGDACTWSWLCTCSSLQSVQAGVGCADLSIQVIYISALFIWCRQHAQFSLPSCLFLPTQTLTCRPRHLRPSQMLTHEHLLAPETPWVLADLQLLSGKSGSVLHLPPSLPAPCACLGCLAACRTTPGAYLST